MAKTLMIQGTTSDAGKSIMVAGICRILARRKVSVAPFKPQNMALNSAVTSDGGEIGRAQALQAEACYLTPHTDMNPILLKPSSDKNAQVIVQGKALSNMAASRYHDYKKVALDAVIDSYHRLSNQYNAIIVEGAGSPAEINLRENDIANMGFAEEVDCPVIIVADIDRGGVFAHLVGTLDLLSSSEQNRVIGFIINRFRGDISLLQSGLDWLENKTGKPVLGVIPYLHDFYIDAEDAIDVKQHVSKQKETLNIVVPVLSRISNHTDFDALRLNPCVNLQFLSLNDTPPPSDLIILPGSKNVREDCRLLKESPWHKYIQKHLRYGGKLIGICGGHQMLGSHIHDPDAVEGKAGSCEALNLIPFETTLKPEKILQNRHGTISLNNQKRPINGYEIHCGISRYAQNQNALIQFEDGNVDGIISDDNQIIGSYLHGLFDSKNACQLLLEWAGLDQAPQIDFPAIRDQQLNRLADELEKSLCPKLLDELGKHLNE